MGLENLQDTLRELAQKGSESPYIQPVEPRYRKSRRRVAYATGPKIFQVPVQLSLFQNL